MAIVRILMLALAAVPIFIGFALPFAYAGLTGLALGAALILCGASLLWWVEHRTRKTLDDDSRLNRILKADGDNILDINDR